MSIHQILIFKFASYEIRPDGSSIALSEARARARYRESLETPKFIETAEPLDYSFETFRFASRRLQAGSKLRLVFGAAELNLYSAQLSSGDAYR